MITSRTQLLPKAEVSSLGQQTTFSPLATHSTPAFITSLHEVANVYVFMQYYLYRHETENGAIF
ncbi:hypothetical protein RMATCC62417_16613 [Rhizopus microsporus]|nr:hypothetical protein RMATCC62417_16613 [Rhizopus microsporus]